MAARVLFFGQDSRRCIPAFKRAGYSVGAYGSVSEMHPGLVEERAADAVAVSGVWEPLLNDSISTVRNRTTIPFIFFAGHGKHPPPSIFDLVISAEQPASQWITEVDLLIRECQATHDHARRVMAAFDLLSERAKALIEQSRLAQESSRLQIESSRSLRAKSRLVRERSLREISGTIINNTRRWDLREIPGVADFQNASPVSTVSCEERDRLNWSIMMALAKLTNLLWEIIRAQVDSQPREQMDALRAEERSQAESLEALLVKCKAHRASHGC